MICHLTHHMICHLTHVYCLSPFSIYHYREAVEHFLTALNMQRSGIGPQGKSSTMSTNIWATLRMTLSLAGRPELYDLADKRELDLLNKEYSIENAT